MKKIQNYLLLLFVFSINFELWDPLDLNIDFFITKVTTLLYLISGLFDFKEYYSIKKNEKFLVPIWTLFILITALNTRYSNEFDKIVFIAFLLNIITMHVIINHLRLQPEMMSKVIKSFLLSTIILSLFYLLKYETSYSIDNRVTVFNMNQNELGIKLSIALLIIISGLNEIGVKKRKFLYYIFAPLLFTFLIQTGSRVAFISLVLGSTIFYLINGSLSASKIFKIILVILSAILIWNYIVLDTFLSQRLVSALTEGDVSGRNLRWSAAFEIFQNHPIVGVGHLGYNEKIETILGYFSSPHNVLIEVLSYSGIIGMILFMFFFINIIRSAIITKRQNKGILPIIFLIPLFGVILSGQILASKIIWLLFAYIIVSTKFFQSKSHKPYTNKQ